MFQYWYNKSGNQFGPYSLDEILSFDLKESTLIFRSDKEDWQSKSKFPELTNSRDIGYTKDQKTFEKSYIDEPFNWWKWSLISSAISFSLIVVCGVLKNVDMAQVFSVAFVLILVVLNIFTYVLLYRNWKIIQDGTVRTTPSKAVGYCFIPLFNMYWIFEAFYGLSLDQEKYLKRKDIKSHTIPKPLYPKITCISILVSILIPFGIILTVIFGILTINNQKNISQSILKCKNI